MNSQGLIVAIHPSNGSVAFTSIDDVGDSACPVVSEQGVIYTTGGHTFYGIDSNSGSVLGRGVPVRRSSITSTVSVSSCFVIFSLSRSSVEIVRIAPSLAFVSSWCFFCRSPLPQKHHR